MKPNMPRRAMQRGFSLLTGFILAIIMFGTLAFFLAGQGLNAGLGASYSNTSKVSGLLVSAGYINTGFDTVTLSGTAASAVTFDSGVAGIFNPTTGGAAPQSVDPTLLARTTAIDGYWFYRGNDVALQGVGGAGNTTGDFTMMVSGLKSAICQQINTTLHGSSATIPALGISDATLVGTPAPTMAVPSAATGTALNLTAVGVSGWMNGCYSTTNGNYVYIHTLLAQ